MKGRAKAAALPLLTSEQGLESLSRLKPYCRHWTLSAESAGSEPPTSERRDEGELGWQGTWQSCFWLYSHLTLAQELLA